MSTLIKSDYAALILRLGLGIMFIAHGLTKLLVFTPAGTAQYFVSLGFPAILGYLTILFEIGGGTFLILGILTRLIAILTVLQMIVITSIHFSNGWGFANSGGGWEYPAFMAMVALALVFVGDGRMSLMYKFKKKSEI